MSFIIVSIGVLGVFFGGLVVSGVGAQPPEATATTGATNSLNLGPVPDGVQVSLTTSKPDWLLGESIPLTFRLENAGTAPFRYSFGGDYRASGRNERFKIRATDQDGNLVADPMYVPANMGGLSTTPELASGTKVDFTIPLVSFCRFEKPGTYTIRVTHDFGWTGTPARPLPEATITLTLGIPNPEQARAILAEASRTSVLLSDGTRGPDYSTLRDPLYLPLLLERARKGDVAAVIGIGNILTPLTTRELIDLSASASLKVAIAACRALNARLPAVSWDWRGPDGGVNPVRAYRIQKAWQPDFAVTVRLRAAVLLTAKEADLVREGAEMIERVGIGEDLSQVTRALNQEMKRFVDSYPAPSTPQFSLLRAARQLYTRDARPPQNPRDKFSGEIASYLIWIQTRGWKTVPASARAKVIPWLTHSLASVRALALETLPERFTAPELTPQQRRAAEAGDAVLKATRKVLPRLLKDKSLVVRIHACEAAVKAQDWSLQPYLQAILSNSKSEWERKASGDALAALGGRFLALKTWATRMDQPGLMYGALMALSGVIAQSGSNGYDQSGESAALAKDLKARWLKFLTDHRKEIEEGKVWTWEDPEAPHNLIPTHFKIYPPNPPISAVPTDHLEETNDESLSVLYPGLSPMGHRPYPSSNRGVWLFGG